MITKRTTLLVLAVLTACIACINTFWVNPHINHALSNWEQLHKLALPEEAESYLEEAKKKQRLQYTLNFVLVALGVTIFNVLFIKSSKWKQGHE